MSEGKSDNTAVVYQKKSKNTLLLILAILQVFCIVFILLFIKSDTQKFISLIDNHNYFEALEMIADSNVDISEEKVLNKIDEAVSLIESDYINNTMVYDVTFSYLKKISLIDNYSHKEKATKAIADISKIKNSRASAELGDKFLKNKEYNKALIEYRKINDKDKVNNSIKKDKINAVYDAAFSNIKSNGSFNDKIEYIDSLLKDATDEEFCDKLTEKEKSILKDWISSETKLNHYVDEKGVLELSIKYDKISGTGTAKEVDKMYREYVDGLIDEKKYVIAYNKIDRDYKTIKEESDYFESKVYKDYCVKTAKKAVDLYKDDELYAAAIEYAGKANKYKKNTVDKKALINEYKEYVEDKIMSQINHARSVNGLNDIYLNEYLSQAAVDLIAVEGFNDLDDNFWDTFSPIIASYIGNRGWACVRYGTKMTDEWILSRIKSFDEVNRESKYSQLGIGLVYYEKTENFDYVIVGVEPK